MRVELPEFLLMLACILGGWMLIRYVRQRN